MDASDAEGGSSTGRKRALALLVGLLVALFVAEIAARVHLGSRFVFGAFVGPPQAICGEFDPDLGWRNRPDTAVDVVAAGGRYHVTINARGERGIERPYAKPAGVARVVLLGDSTAWGWGVDDELMWPRLVERELAGRVEIINLAVPGYGTDQELWCLDREGLKYEPDLVLLAFVHNDTLSNNMALMQGMQKPQYVLDPASGEWSLLNRPVPPPEAASELAQRRFRRRLSMYSAVAMLFEPPPPQPSRYDLDDPKVQAGVERLWNQLVDPSKPTAMLLARLSETTHLAGAQLVAFTFPHLVDRWLYDPTTPLPDGVDRANYRTYVSVKLAEAGRALGFATFSVDQALLDEVSRGTNLDCGDEHLNARGNEIVAGVVAERLREWLDAAR